MQSGNDCRTFRAMISIRSSPADMSGNHSKDSPVSMIRKALSMATPPSLRRTAWHEAGHAVVAWDQRFKVVLVSIRPEGESFGRSSHTPAGNCAIASERQRESIVAMGGWAAEHASGEVGDRTYDGGDLSWVLSSIAEHAPTQVASELGWAESEAERIVRANIERVDRLAKELIKREELADAAEILAIIEGDQT
jgi:ATP-dependent Zn protease